MIIKVNNVKVKGKVNIVIEEANVIIIIIMIVRLTRGYYIKYNHLLNSKYQSSFR